MVAYLKRKLIRCEALQCINMIYSQLTYMKSKLCDVEGRLTRLL